MSNDQDAVSRRGLLKQSALALAGAGLYLSLIHI